MLSSFVNDLVVGLRELDKGFIKSIYILFDAIRERLMRGFSLEEYFSILKLYQIPPTKRAEYLSNKSVSKIEKQLNCGRLRSFDDKGMFLARNAELVRRDWVLVDENKREAFFSFIEKHPRFVDKPNMGSFGAGIIIRDISGYSQKKKELLFQKLKGRLLEEIVIGCRELQLYHPSSLNTIRMITINRTQNEPDLAYSFVKLGRGDNVVDNGHLGGLCVMLDLCDGHALGDAYCSDGKVYRTHPDTGYLISDLVVPYWTNIIEFTKKCAYMNPDAVLAGWDIAINEQHEPILIEGNCTPNIDLIQAGLGRGIKNELLKMIMNM